MCPGVLVSSLSHRGYNKWACVPMLNQNSQNLFSFILTGMNLHLARWTADQEAGSILPNVIVGGRWLRVSCSDAEAHLWDQWTSQAAMTGKWSAQGFIISGDIFLWLERSGKLNVSLLPTIYVCSNRSAIVIWTTPMCLACNYLCVRTEEWADSTVWFERSYCSIEGFLCQEVRWVILPQVLLLLHVAIHWHGGGHICG